MGAIYKFASIRRLCREETERLLVERCGMKADAARKLVGHWFTNCQFRGIHATTLARDAAVA